MSAQSDPALTSDQRIARLTSELAEANERQAATSQVLDSGAADVAFIFTTDGDLASGKYVILDDDKKFFPPYNITFAIRNEALDTIGPDGQKVIEDVQKPLTEKVMQELNARVDVDKQKPEDAAKAYLQSAGFIPKS